MTEVCTQFCERSKRLGETATHREGCLVDVVPTRSIGEVSGETCLSSDSIENLVIMTR